MIFLKVNQFCCFFSSSGFFTAKGDLVSSILYPQPTNFRFYQDSVKFLLILCTAGKKLGGELVETQMSFWNKFNFFHNVFPFSSAFFGTVYSFVVLFRACVSADTFLPALTNWWLVVVWHTKINELNPDFFPEYESRTPGWSWWSEAWILSPLRCPQRCQPPSPRAPSTPSTGWRSRASSASVHLASTSLERFLSSALTRWGGNLFTKV